MKQIKKAKRLKDRSATENLLIEAAIKIFSSHGFSRATTRMIAQEAGVNLALITRYFGNKRGLLLAILESGERRERPPLPYPPQQTLKKECVAFAEASFRRVMEGEKILRIIMVESITDPEFSQAIHELDLFHPNREFMSRIASHVGPKQAEATIKKLVSMVERVVLGTIGFQYLIGGDSYDKCLADMSASMDAFFQLSKFD